MKAIFLDIEGVLNSEQFFLQKARDTIELDKEKIKLLKQIVEATDAKIVLSSTWRMLPDNHPDFRSLIKFLEDENLSIFDKTPSLSAVRGVEIQEWLNNHPEVTNFVILDDDDDMEELKKFLVRPSWAGDGGLKPEHVIQAIKILQGENDE